MSDANDPISDPGHVFDQTNGQVGGLDGDSDGTAGSDAGSDADRDLDADTTPIDEGSDLLVDGRDAESREGDR